MMANYHKRYRESARVVCPRRLYLVNINTPQRPPKALPLPLLFCIIGLEFYTHLPINFFYINADKEAREQH